MNIIDVRIIIAGSRTFNDYEFLKVKCNEIINSYFLGGWVSPNLENVTIISGGANGADKLGERFAKENNIECKLFPANWDAYGKSAGYKRNLEMAYYAKEMYGVLIAFWDGKSRGTNHMIDIAKQLGLNVYIFSYNEKQISLGE
jgi:hypothetical protein